MGYGNIILCHVRDQLPKEGKLQSTEWIEVWVDGGTKGEYFLVLRALSDGSLAIVNPHAQNAVVKAFQKYDEAVHWLTEDEYELIDGRWFPNGE